jgi:KipI family sensor histidine kinase inhibitor
MIYGKPKFSVFPGSILYVEVGDEVSLGCNARVHGIFSALCGLQGISEITPAYASLAARIDLESTKVATVIKVIEKEWARPREKERAGRLVKVPVCYQGEFAPDLDWIAERVGIEKDEVVALHSSKEYTCMMMGFMPGFVYLDEVNSKIAAERLETPRTKVPAGSVGIAGAQTGIYGLESPGGWRLIGRTPLTMFNPMATPPVPIELGDRVKFEPISTREFGFVKKASLVRPPMAAGTPLLEVKQPGLFATLQDMGRSTFRHLGVPSSGALDIISMLQSNYLVGNPGSWPVVEVMGGYFKVKALREMVVAVTGCECNLRVEGEPAKTYVPLLLRTGDELAIGNTSGMLNYLSIAGRLVAASVMGSCSTYSKGGFGGYSGRSLKVGDVLGAESLSELVLMRDVQETEKVLLGEGPMRAMRSSLGGNKAKVGDAFFDREYLMSESSDRTGYRLKSSERFLEASGQVITYPTYTGYVQVPPDGSPIVLQRDCPTTGGYELAAVVLPSEMGRLSQLKPGSKVTFEEVSEDVASRDDARFSRLLKKYGTIGLTL